MFPRIVVDYDKLKSNVRFIKDQTAKLGVTTYFVTKSFCAREDIVKAMIEAGAEHVADSRISNLAKLKDLPVTKTLLRLPMHSEVALVVRYADLSFNSELSTLKLLGQEAIAQGKNHNVLLMIDLGDLREGETLENSFDFVKESLLIKGINVKGIGTNLTCYGGVIPTDENLSELCKLSKRVEEELGFSFEIISGGNSSSYYMLQKLPKGINNLRIGELFLLGRETAYGDRVDGLFDDVFTLEAQIIELKQKDTLPKGLIGMDAFGNTPDFEDKGKRLRGIVALGKQDVSFSNLYPIDDGLEFFGGSSDHIIMDFTISKKKYSVGDIVSFKLEYGSLLSLFTSPYVL